MGSVVEHSLHLYWSTALLWQKCLEEMNKLWFLSNGAEEIDLCILDDEFGVVLDE